MSPKHTLPCQLKAPCGVRSQHLGVPASLVIGRLLQNNVVRADSRDPVMFIAMVAVLAIVALVASIVPARRATRLEPTTALRIE